MPEVRAPVDTEALIVAHLKADSEVLALIDEERVSTETPGDRAGLWVKLDRLPGSNAGTPETAHLERARVQFSIFGDTRPTTTEVAAKPATWDLTAAVFRSVFRLPDVAIFPGYGIVTGVEAEVFPYWSPDPETDDPRYLFVAAVFVHP